ncbi:MAG: hypothetical protein HZA80_00780 [Candidatus Taylorbacteria bacterium]|nr:hypothetical protein [Candidatus Taylorbacteria bacterium]
MKKILFIIATLLILTNPSEGKAAIQSYKLLEPLPCIGTTQECVGGRVEQVDLKSYVGYIFKLVIALAGAIAVFRITWGGFKYMTTDAIFGKQEGKKEVKDAIYGLIMILASYLILRTIDPRLVNINTEIKPIEQAEYIDMNSLFTDVEEASKTLSEANKTAGELRAQIAALRAQAGTTTDEDLSIRLRTEALNLERKAENITANAVADVNFDLARKSLQQNTEVSLSTSFKTDLESRIRVIEKSVQTNVQQLTDLGDIDGAAKLKDKGNFYVMSVRDELDFTEKFKKIEEINNTRTTWTTGLWGGPYLYLLGKGVDKIKSKNESIVVAGDTLISELRAKESKAQQSTDPALQQGYLDNLHEQIKQTEDLIKPLRPNP